MERGRILILGNSKEATYEIRSLLDNQRFEVEIALSSDVGRAVLSSRQMNLVMLHSAMLENDDVEFLGFLREKLQKTPVAILGEEADSAGKKMELDTDVGCFAKPYSTDQLLEFIRSL